MKAFGLASASHRAHAMGRAAYEPVLKTLSTSSNGARMGGNVATAIGAHYGIPVAMENKFGQNFPTVLEVEKHAGF
jgi:hypothetical protein